MHPSDVLDMPVDPNEPTYCLCSQVSYGEMIGCDNSDVSNEYNICFKPLFGKWKLFSLLILFIMLCSIHYTGNQMALMDRC